MTVHARRSVRLEHRLTRPNASLADLDAAVSMISGHDVAALTVSPWLVKAARRQLGRSRVRVGTVVGYGHGGQLLSVKAFEASKALEQGASQIDFVMNAGALVSGEDEIVYNDMLAVVDMAHSALAAVGVILEAEPLSEEYVRKACRLAERAGVDYVVTGRGSSSARISIGRTAMLREALGSRVQLKASGRFRTADEIDQAAQAGAARVSAALTASLIRKTAETVELADAAELAAAAR